MSTSNHNANQVGSEISITRDAAKKICEERGLNYNDYYKKGSVMLKPGTIMVVRGFKHYVVSTETKPYNPAQDESVAGEYEQHQEKQSVQYLRRQFRSFGLTNGIATSQEMTLREEREQRHAS